MNISYEQLRQIIETFSNAHLQVKRFKSDYEDQLSTYTTKEESFPFLYMAPVGGSLGFTQNTFNIRFTCLDIIEKDRENWNTIVSDCHLILNDLYKFLQDGDYGVSVNDNNEPNITPINDATMDYLAGWYMELNIQVDTYSDCLIPFDGIPVYTGGTGGMFIQKYLTCDTLEDCPVIEAIQDDITNLETIVYRTNELISGGASFLSGLTYDVTPLEYIINGQFYTTAAATQVTANSGDTNFDRIDLIVADINGTVSILEGTPSANPVQPDVDETTQVVVAILTVPAGATAISIAETIVYEDNLGIPTEWDAFSNSPTIDLTYSSVTYNGSLTSIYFNQTPNTFQASFYYNSAFDTTTQNTLQFKIYNTVVWTTAQRINLKLTSLAGVQIGSTVQLYHGKYGFSRYLLNTWQTISIPISAFSPATNIISRIYFQSAITTGIGLTCIIDQIKLIEGVAIPSPVNSWYKIQGDTGAFSYPLTNNATLFLKGGTNINTIANTSGSVTNSFSIHLDNDINLNSVSATTISATTFYGDGSNLTGIPQLWTDGGNTSLYPTGFGSTTSTGFGSITAAYNSLASSFYGSIWGGLGHTNSAYYAAIVGGLSNTISSTASNNYGFIGGGRINVISGTARHGVILGGESNQLTAGNHSAIVGGVSSTISNQGSFIGGGSNHTISWNYSGLIGGRYNTIHALYSFQGGSYSSDITGWYAGIIGGIDNNVTGYYSGIFGGSANTITHTHSTILGGSGLSSVADNTAHVPYLNINQTDFTTTADTYNDIVIDNNGNIKKNNQFYIGVNFEESGVTWNYVAPESFLIYSIDNPSSITYDLLHNGTAYTFNNTISLYDDLQITGVTSTGFLKLNSRLI